MNLDPGHATDFRTRLFHRMLELVVLFVQIYSQHHGSRFLNCTLFRMPTRHRHPSQDARHVWNKKRTSGAAATMGNKRLR